MEALTFFVTSRVFAFEGFLADTPFRRVTPSFWCANSLNSLERRSHWRLVR
jgi:hypothetical protein